MRDILAFIVFLAAGYCAGEFLWWLARGVWVLIVELVGLLGKRGVRR